VPASSHDFAGWKEQSGLSLLVETGTYIGGGIRHALRGGFQRVISIEASPRLFEDTKKMFLLDSRVTIVHGDSSIMMTEILGGVNEPAVFWLDAHYSMGNTFNGPDPLVEELRTISSWKHAPESWIIADDCVIDSSRIKNSSFMKKTHRVEEIQVTVPTDEGYGSNSGLPWKAVRFTPQEARP